MTRENVLIVSSKKEGNTYEVASYMAENSNATLYIIEENCSLNLKNYEHIIVCSGVYADGIHKLLANWLTTLKKEHLHPSVKVHLFLTWFGRGKSDVHAMKQTKKTLLNNNIPFNQDYGSCFGGKFFIRKGHPNIDDFTNALNWLNKQVN